MRILSRSSILHFIMKQFIQKRVLSSQYQSSYMAEIQRINFMMTNSIKRIKLNSQFQMKLYQNNQQYLLDNPNICQKIRKLYFEIQQFIKNKQLLFKKNSTYLIRKSFIQTLLKIQKIFVQAKVNDFKQRQKNLQHLLRLRHQGQNTHGIPFIMNILQSQSDILKKCLGWSITVDNIQFHTYEMKETLKQLIKNLRNKQQTIQYLQCSHQSIYINHSIKVYKRAIAIQFLFQSCQKTLIQINQNLKYQAIKLFDEYIKTKQFYPPEAISKLLLRFFFIIVKQDSQLSKQNRQKIIAGLNISSKQVQESETLQIWIIKNQDLQINNNLYQNVVRLLQVYGLQIFQNQDILKSNQLQCCLKFMVRATVMDQCYFAFSLLTLSCSIQLMLQFKFNQRKQFKEDKFVHNQLFNQIMKQQDKEKLLNCAAYLQNKYYIAMRMYFENQKNPFYEKKFARIVLNNTVRLY